MDQLATLVSQVSDFVWNNLLLYILVLTGIIFSIRLKFHPGTQVWRRHEAGIWRHQPIWQAG